MSLLFDKYREKLHNYQKVKKSRLRMFVRVYRWYLGFEPKLYYQVPDAKTLGYKPNVR